MEETIMSPALEHASVQEHVSSDQSKVHLVTERLKSLFWCFHAQMALSVSHGKTTSTWIEKVSE